MQRRLKFNYLPLLTWSIIALIGYAIHQVKNDWLVTSVVTMFAGGVLINLLGLIHARLEKRSFTPKLWKSMAKCGWASKEIDTYLVTDKGTGTINDSEYYLEVRIETDAIYLQNTDFLPSCIKIDRSRVLKMHTVNFCRQSYAQLTLSAPDGFIQIPWSN